MTMPSSGIPSSRRDFADEEARFLAQQHQQMLPQRSAQEQYALDLRAQATENEQRKARERATRIASERADAERLECESAQLRSQVDGEMAAQRR
eukprot:SAG31_NODE_26991_length_433_cov_0.619760_1_plen_93_part_10